MFERVKMKPIKDHIWLMNDNDEATGYLVIGSQKALIIDTMNGYENVREIAETITSLPLMVVNTHGHPDHIYGNIYFEEAYLHPDDLALAQQFYQEPMFTEAIEQMKLKPADFRPIHAGDVIDLGGLELEVYGVPGHTPGGICLLDRQDRILFTGDSIIEQTWMQLEESLPMEVFLQSLDTLKSIRGEYDFILTGHSRDLEDASLYEAHRNAVKEVCEGKKENDIPYEWFGGTSKAHPYGSEPRRIVYK
ncbi:MBL fold metallo-hydrolase [Gorillibacterium timonense]|uniref:MBL fold metallo-hydrolase n=1 Tax=Gorillibacterium timonense TaxID=1689269 RepID=UPI00071CBFF0|nr:MBL fold metallo-hydrolase [Gorillibacterium timonense]